SRTGRSTGWGACASFFGAKFGMIRGTAFHAVGFGLLGFWLVVAPQPAAADPVVEAYPGGATTTYFGPSAKPATDAPAKGSTPPAEAAPATTVVTPAPSEAPAAAAVAPAPDAKASPPAAAAAAP